ncbi:helix-turn-helix domain-containing protein [Streptomyces goshikiensis]|uniref:helix-turn-helix domain-containing protein n=2 Tax=Streptomyces TaxID=1883 RepID=UPI0036A70E13
MTQNVGTTSGESQDPEPVLPAPGERRKLREAAHLTYEQVAATVGVTGTTVRSWELGRTEPRGRKRESYAAFLAGLSERAAAHGHPAGGHARPRPKSPAKRAPHDPAAPSRTPAPPPSRSTHPGPTTPTAQPLPTTPSAQPSPRPKTPPSPHTAHPPPPAATASPHPPAQPPQATHATQAPPSSQPTQGTPPHSAHATEATPSPQPTQTTPPPQPAQSAHATQATPTPQTAHTDRAAGATPSPQSTPAPQVAPPTHTTPATPAASAAPADPARATPVGPAITGMSAPEAAPDASEPRAAMGAPAIVGMSPPGAPATPATANGSASTGADAPAIPGTPNPLDAQAAAAPEVAPGAPGSTDTPIARWDPSALAPAGAPAAPAANGSAATGADTPEVVSGPPGAPASPWTPNPLDAPPAAAELAPSASGAAGSPEAPAAGWDPSALDPADAPASPGEGAAGAVTAGGLDTPPAAAPGAQEAPGADSGDPAEPPAPLTPADVFDALYDRAAPALLRQAYLLTGRRALAMESVERAFHLAWNRWPELIADPDPVGWVRSAAYEYALSPWHQFRRAHRHPDKPPAEPADRILLDAMLQLSPMHRRTVLLYDGIGLDLPDTAAETEATTPTAGSRLLRAHAELAARIPELAAVPPEKQSAVLRHRLGALRPSVPLEPRPAVAVRGSGEHRTRLWGRAVLGLTAMIAVATSYTLSTAPTHYIPPLAPGASVSGVPPLSGPQHLTQRSKKLHDKLRNAPEAGPARLAPKAE